MCYCKILEFSVQLLLLLIIRLENTVYLPVLKYKYNIWMSQNIVLSRGFSSKTLKEVR